MRRNYRITLILSSAFILLSGCSGFTDRTAAVSVCFDGSSLCRSADSADAALGVKLINAETGAVIGTETKTVSSSDSQTEISFTAETGLSVYLHAELTQSGTVVASGDSDTVTVETSGTEISLALEWGKGSVAVSVTQGETPSDSCSFSLTVASPDSASSSVTDSTGITLTAGYAYTLSLGAEVSGTAVSYDSSALVLYSGRDSVLSSTTGAVTVPAYFVAGTYTLYMEAYIDGICYTGHEAIIVK
jgi:hypothetical protein